MLITKSCCSFSTFSGISPPAILKSPVLALLFLKRHAAVLCCLYTCFYVSSFVCFAGWTMPREKGTPFIMAFRRKSQEVVHFYSSSIVLEVVLKFIIFLANKNSLQSASQRSPRNARLRSEKVWFLFYFPWKEGRTRGKQSLGARRAFPVWVVNMISYGDFPLGRGEYKVVCQQQRTPHRS